MVVAPPDSTDGPADERSTDAEAKPATPPPRSRGPPEPVQCRRTARRPGLTGHPVPSTRNQVLFTPKSKPFSTERLAVRPRHRTQRNTDRVKQVTTNRGHCPPPQPLVRIHRIGCPESTGTGVRNHRNAQDQPAGPMVPGVARLLAGQLARRPGVIWVRASCSRPMTEVSTSCVSSSRGRPQLDDLETQLLDHLGLLGQGGPQGNDLLGQFLVGGRVSAGRRRVNRNSQRYTRRNTRWWTLPSRDLTSYLNPS